MKEAKRIAAEAAKEGKSLADVVPADRKDNFKAGVGPFSWLTMVGRQGFTIGNVLQLDSVGEQFMKAVFDTKVDELAVAMNQPERVAYVIQPRGFQPTMEALQQQYSVEFFRMMASQVAASDGSKILQGFYESLDERTGFETRIGQ